MAPQKQNSAAGNPLVAFGSGGKANGLCQSSSAAMAAAKKPNVQHIQADHELFLQAFESESLPFTSIFHLQSFRSKVTGAGHKAAWLVEQLEVHLAGLCRCNNQLLTSRLFFFFLHV